MSEGQVERAEKLLASVESCWAERTDWFLGCIDSRDKQLERLTDCMASLETFRELVNGPDGRQALQIYATGFGELTKRGLLAAALRDG